MKIRLKTISDVNSFSKACSDYYSGNIDVKQGRQVIDGKSVLGIFSLNLMEPLNVNITTDNKDVEHDFYNFLRKWRVNEEVEKNNE